MSASGSGGGPAWRPPRSHRSLLDFGLGERAERSRDLVRLLVLFLLTLDPQDQFFDLLALRLHPLLREPVGQVDGQVEALDGVLWGNRVFQVHFSSHRF